MCRGLRPRCACKNFLLRIVTWKHHTFRFHSLDPLLCRDLDTDSCDDCSVGRDGFGPLLDYDVDNDGLDSNSDGQCNLTDPDDDGDGILDGEDNCPVDTNPDQADANKNDVGDFCEDEDGFCFPVKSTNIISLICL